MSGLTNHDEEMRSIERALKSALRRKQAPARFAQHVMAQADEQARARDKAASRNPWVPVLAWPVVRWTAAAAATAAMLLGVVHYREVRIERERAEGEAAKQQLVLALRIAGSKLQHARSKVNQIQANPAEDREEKE